MLKYNVLLLLSIKIKIFDLVVNLTIKEHKEVTKQESQQAFDQLLKRFQNSLKFEDNRIELLNKVKEALDYINTAKKFHLSRALCL